MKYKMKYLLSAFHFGIGPRVLLGVACIDFFSMLNVAGNHTLSRPIEDPVYEHFPGAESLALIVIFCTSNFFENTIQSYFRIRQAILTLLVKKATWHPSSQVVSSSTVFIYDIAQFMEPTTYSLAGPSSVNVNGWALRRRALLPWPNQWNWVNSESRTRARHPQY